MTTAMLPAGLSPVRLPQPTDDLRDSTADATETQSSAVVEAFHRLSFAGTELSVATRVAFEQRLRQAYPTGLVFSFPEAYSDEAAEGTGLWSFEVFVKDSEPDPEACDELTNGYAVDFCDLETVSAAFVAAFTVNFQRFQVP